MSRRHREFYGLLLAGNPIGYGAQVVGVNKIKSFMKIICKRMVLLETLLTTVTVASVLVPVSCTAHGWTSRLSWREWDVGQNSRSESTRSCREVSDNVSKSLDPPAPRVLKMEATAPHGE